MDNSQEIVLPRLPGGVWPLVFSGRVALDGLAGGEIGFGKACGSI